MRILDFLKKGALVELVGTPFAKAFVQEDGFVRTEIRLNVSKTNILRPAKSSDSDDRDDYEGDEFSDEDEYGDSGLDDFTIDADDF